MTITNPRELAKYRSACTLSVDLLHQIYTFTTIGLTTLEIDQKAGELLRKNNVKSAFYGVQGEHASYRHNMCIAINDVIVHGVPNKTVLRPGDIVKLDFGIIKDGFYTDHCVTIIMSPSGEQEIQFVQTAKDATLKGVAVAHHNNHAGDIGHAIHTHLQSHGYDVAKEYIGHSIGKSLHERPNIPAYGRPGTGADIRNGMVLCVEAQVVAGTDKWYLERDGWTVRTADHQNAAMFEYMVLVDNDTPQILTDTRDWPIVK